MHTSYDAVAHLCMVYVHVHVYVYAAKPMCMVQAGKVHEHELRGSVLVCVQLGRRCTSADSACE
jgi:hypothetical protein